VEIVVGPIFSWGIFFPAIVAGVGRRGTEFQLARANSSDFDSTSYVQSQALFFAQSLRLAENGIMISSSPTWP
jgi:hypothetical protein